MATTLESMLFDFFREALDRIGYSGVQVIRENQNGGTIYGEHLTYRVLGDERLGSSGVEEREENTPVDDNMQATNTRRYRVSVSVHLYAEEGMLIFRKLREAASIWEVRAILQNAGASLSSMGGTSDLTFLDVTQYRRRYQSNFSFLIWGILQSQRPKVNTITASGNIHLDK